MARRLYASSAPVAAPQAVHAAGSRLPLTRFRCACCTYGATSRLEPERCPMCGGTMQLKQTIVVSHIPGYRDAEPKKTLEWVCPDCDYFEEADGENA